MNVEISNRGKDQPFPTNAIQLFLSSDNPSNYRATLADLFLNFFISDNMEGMTKESRSQLAYHYQCLIDLLDAFESSNKGGAL